jgi:hypothetical protein
MKPYISDACRLPAADFDPSPDYQLSPRRRLCGLLWRGRGGRHNSSQSASPEALQ